ncbi:MAG: hypothetical protein ACRDRS_06405 [Pseudonocardiaceae bacterium]
MTGAAMMSAWLWVTVPDVVTLPAAVTASGPGRWIVLPGPGTAAPSRPRAVLSAAWRTVAV